MLTEKQQRHKAQEREHYRRLLCKKCGSVMEDCEPASRDGEFYHPKNDCVNSGRRFTWNPPPDRIPPHPKWVKDPNKRFGKYIRGETVSGIVQMSYSSKERRARRRGAKLASKHRPR